MKSIAILFFILIVITSCKEGKDPNAESKTIQDSIAKTETVNKENSNSEATELTGSNSENSQEDWYWKNTVMSKNDKFENWKEGDATLVMTYKMKQNDNQPRTFKVGNITSDGAIKMNLPKEIKTETKLDNLGNLVFYDLQDVSNLKYENGNTGYFSNTTIQVEKDGTTIGNLTMGNSVRTTYNLTNQSTLTMGDEGYLVYLAYVNETAEMKGIEKRTDKVRRDGTNTIEAETTVVYDLNFKPRWNYVKTEVIGSYNLEHERGLNASWFKKHEHKVVPEMPKTAEYFFRKISY